MSDSLQIGCVESCSSVCSRTLPGRQSASSGKLAFQRVADSRTEFLNVHIAKQAHLDATRFFEAIVNVEQKVAMRVKASPFNPDAFTADS